MYVADSGNNKIRRITPAGVITTIAGTGVATDIGRWSVIYRSYSAGDGDGAVATFNSPTDIVFDSTGTIMYVADSGNNKIRKIVIGGTSTLPTYTVSTIAGGKQRRPIDGVEGTSGAEDGVGSFASFNRPTGIVLDSAGNLYVADSENHRIRKIVIGRTTEAPIYTTYTVSTIAGGPPTEIPVSVPSSSWVVREPVPYTASYTFGDGIGQGAARFNIYDPNNFWQDPTKLGATFNTPTNIVFDSTGTIMYVADSGNNKIRKIVIGGTEAAPTYTVSTIAGGAGYEGVTTGSIDGPGATAKFNNPVGIMMDYDNNLYVADRGNNKIRKIVIGGTAAAPTYTVSTIIAGTIDGTAIAKFSMPVGLLLDYDGVSLYVFNTGTNKILKIKEDTVPEPTSIITTPTAISGASTEYPIISPSNKIDEITFQKLKQTTAWDASLYSNESIPGDKSCYISFKPGQITTQFIIGLNDSISTTNPTDLRHSFGIDRGFHMNKEGDGKFYIREFGAKVDGTDGTYVAGDVFNIIYDTTKFIYIKNGTRVRTIPVNSRPTLLYLDGSMYEYGTIIQNVYFGKLNNCPVPATT